MTQRRTGKTGNVPPIGKIIRKRRRELDITQETLAAQIDINPKTLIWIEQGKTNPRWDLACTILAALDIEVAWEVKE